MHCDQNNASAPLSVSRYVLFGVMSFQFTKEKPPTLSDGRQS